MSRGCDSSPRPTRSPATEISSRKPGKRHADSPPPRKATPTSRHYRTGPQPPQWSCRTSSISRLCEIAIFRIARNSRRVEAWLPDNWPLPIPARSLLSCRLHKRGNEADREARLRWSGSRSGMRYGERAPAPSCPRALSSLNACQIALNDIALSPCSFRRVRNRDIVQAKLGVEALRLGQRSGFEERATRRRWIPISTALADTASDHLLRSWQ